MTDPSPGLVVDGRFTTERLLGAGGMGTVWLARDANLGGRPVALKLLRPRLTGQALGARFRREAALMARLRHPGLIDVYDVRLTGPQPYIAQEYVDGSDLAALLARSGPLPPAAVARLARELAETLAYLHAQRVVHRDLKPSNVMIQLDGRSRLADLGLARDEDGTCFTEEGTMVGTVLYMPPETILNEPTTAASDVFSYGLVLWEAATCRHPYLNTGELTEYMSRLAGRALTLGKPPPELPAALTALMVDCLRLRPEERPADGNALVARLDGPSPAVIEPAPPAAPRLLPPPRRPVRAAAALTTALLLGGLLLLLHLRSPATPGPGPGPARPAAPLVSCLLDGVRLECPGPVPGGLTARLTTTSGELLSERPLRGGGVTLHAPAGFAGPVTWSVGGTRARTEGTATVGLRLLRDAVPAFADAPPAAHDGCLVLALKGRPPLALRPRREPGRLLELVAEEARGVPPPLPPLTLALPGGGTVAARGATLAWTAPDGTRSSRILDLGIQGAVAGLIPSGDGGLLVIEARLTAPPAPTLVTLSAFLCPTEPLAPLPPATRLAIVTDHIGDVLPVGVATLPGKGFALAAARTLVLCRSGLEGDHRSIPLPERCRGLVFLEGALLVVARSGRVHGFELPL